MNDTWDEFHYFSTPVYKLHKPEFLESVRDVAYEHTNNTNLGQKLNDIYPVRMSDNLFNETRIKNFSDYCLNTAWQVLAEQGYMMDDKLTVYESMWMQEHHKHSLMEKHNHPGCQLVGFYFVDVPNDSSRAVFYDPRIRKTQNDLVEFNSENITVASSMINFEPKEGDLFFTNSWLEHSFIRNSSDKPFRFIHFNISVIYNPNYQYVCPTNNCISLDTEAKFEYHEGPEVI